MKIANSDITNCQKPKFALAPALSDRAGLAAGRGRRSEPRSLLTGMVCLGLIAVATLLALLFGGCSTTPTALDRTLFTTLTNQVVKEVQVTNIVQVPQYVPQIINITNFVQGQAQVTPQMVTLTNWVNQTNITAIQVTNPVVTLAGSSTLTTTVASVAGTAVNAFVPGTGTLVTAGLGGLLAIIMGMRNRTLNGKNNVLSQSAGALAQIIETGREIMGKTSQGAALSDQFTAWMKTHQAETGTISAISEVVKNAVDNGEAKDAADQILALMGGSKGTATVAVASKS